MSADNYFTIRKHPAGGYAAVMGFASDRTEPKATIDHWQFETVPEALAYADEQWTEYGVSIHPEVGYVPPATKIAQAVEAEARAESHADCCQWYDEGASSYCKFPEDSEYHRPPGIKVGPPGRPDQAFYKWHDFTPERVRDHGAFATGRVAAAPEYGENAVVVILETGPSPRKFKGTEPVTIQTRGWT